MPMRTFLGVDKMNRNVVVALACAALSVLPTSVTAQSTGAPVNQMSPATAVTPETTKERQDLAELFDKVDRNHDGRMTRQEMQIFGMQNRIGSLINRKTWKRADKDGNGWISQGEYVDYALDQRMRQKARGRRRR